MNNALWGEPWFSERRGRRQSREDRVLYGSDIPFHHPSVEMQRVKVAGLTEAQLQKVFYENAGLSGKEIATCG